MPDQAPTWLPPRPLRPATAMRTVSLAPRTRPEDLVPAMVTRAPAPAALRKSRRVVSGMERGPFVLANAGRAGWLLRYHRGRERPRKMRPRAAARVPLGILVAGGFPPRRGATW